MNIIFLLFNIAKLYFKVYLTILFRFNDLWIHFNHFVYLSLVESLLLHVENLLFFFINQEVNQLYLSLCWLCIHIKNVNSWIELFLFVLGLLFAKIYPTKLFEFKLCNQYLLLDDQDYLVTSFNKNKEDV